MANKLLLRLEKKLGLGPYDTAEVLGIAYVTYNQYKNETRALPKYIRRHADALMLVDMEVSDAIVRSVLEDDI